MKRTSEVEVELVTFKCVSGASLGSERLAANGSGAWLPEAATIEARAANDGNSTSEAASPRRSTRILSDFTLMPPAMMSAIAGVRSIVTALLMASPITRLHMV
jgi:hypothetical protein